jgi:hypothetical protein
MLFIAGAGWLTARNAETDADPNVPQFGLIALQSIAIPALVVARAEGALLAALVLLPTLLCRHIAPKFRIFLLCVFGASVVAWNLFLLSALPEDLRKPMQILPPLGVGALSLGVASLLGLPWVRKQFATLEKQAPLILIAAGATLWVALAASALWQPKLIQKSIDATVQNLFYGAGGWGYSLIALAILITVCAAIARGNDLIFLRFPVISYIPLGFLLAVFREGAYRVGPGDSLNRMWIHIVPLAILYVIAAVSSMSYRRLPSMLSRIRPVPRTG